MMNQFEVIRINGGRRMLCLSTADRWDFYIGFRTVIKELA